MVPGLYLAYTDAKSRIIPDWGTFAIFITGFIYAVYSGNVKNALLGAGIGFAILYLTALLVCGVIGGKEENGIGGGDIKLAAGLGMWFGFLPIAKIILIGTFISIVWDLYRKYRSGVLVSTIKERIIPFYKSLYMRLVYKIDSAVPEIYEDISLEEFIPMGTFIVMAAWVYWLMMLGGN